MALVPVSDAEPLRKKRKGPREPNPLSVKKKKPSTPAPTRQEKTTPNTAVGQKRSGDASDDEEVGDVHRRKRKRRHKGKPAGEVDNTLIAHPQ
jgi:U3 small nucleolar RNA-associated protein 23